MKTKTEEFIDKIKLKNNPNHFNKDGSLRYDYSKTIYTKALEKVIITCLEHGIFEQRPTNHLRGQGCMKCKIKHHAKTTDNFIKEAKLKHNNKYDYSKTKYKKSIEEVTIICPEHGIFKQTPHGHLKGQGCMKCSNLGKGWNKESFKNNCIKNNNGLGVLYILYCFNELESFYKIGITSNDVKTRYRNSPIPYNYKIIHEVHREPIKIYDMENKLLRALAKNSYKPLIPFTGQTECFTDIEALYKIFKDKLAA